MKCDLFLHNRHSSPCQLASPVPGNPSSQNSHICCLPQPGLSEMLLKTVMDAWKLPQNLHEYKPTWMWLFKTANPMPATRCSLYLDWLFCLVQLTFQNTLWFSIYLCDSFLFLLYCLSASFYLKISYSLTSGIFQWIGQTDCGGHLVSVSRV